MNRQNKSIDDAWQDRPEAGNALAIRTTIWIALKLRRRVLGIILYLVAIYFYLVRKNERRASREFLRRIHGQSPKPGQVISHFTTFAQVTADRIYFLAKPDIGVEVEIRGWDIMERFVRSGRGAVMLGCHLGSFEAARLASIRHPGVTVRMVIDRGFNENLMGELEALNPEFSSSLIDANQPTANLGLTIGDALARGESVGFMSDRFRKGDRTTTCNFLGSPAEFPVGPLVIASLFHAPVVAIFGIYVNRRYEVYCEELFDKFHITRENRDDKLQQAMQLYVDRLEYYVRRAPDNWFNFYDFWPADNL